MTTTTRPRQARAVPVGRDAGACQIIGCIEDATALVWVIGEPEADSRRLCARHHRSLLGLLASPDPRRAPR